MVVSISRLAVGFWDTNGRPQDAPTSAAHVILASFVLKHAEGNYNYAFALVVFVTLILCR